MIVILIGYFFGIERNLTDPEFYLVCVVLCVILFMVYSKKQTNEFFQLHPDIVVTTEEGIENVVQEEMPVGSFNMQAYKRLANMPLDVKEKIIPSLEKTIRIMTGGMSEEDASDGQPTPKPDELHEISSEYYVKNNVSDMLKNGKIDETKFSSVTQNYYDCHYALYNLKMWLPELYSQVLSK